MYWVIAADPNYFNWFYSRIQAEWYAVRLQQSGIDCVVSSGVTVGYNNNV